MALTVLGLALYRMWIAKSEDDSLHISGDGSGVERQKIVSKQLELIDRIGKALTIVAFIFGIGIVAAAGYIVFQR